MAESNLSSISNTSNFPQINFLQFIPDGRLLISVGGFTNFGISDPNDALGGIPPNPYSAAIISCPISGAKITYSDINNPLNTTVTGGSCEMYAAGLRNAYAAEYHTNNQLYASDNSGNRGFGDVSRDCFGRRSPSENVPDMLIKVEEGRCHGHPNLSRGIAGKPEECTPQNAKCVQPLISNLRSSTNGVLEYRSNLFGGRLKGDLFLTLFSDTRGKRGRVTRVQLNQQGTLRTNGVTTIFQDNSGLSIVEGPRGEMIMSRVFKDTFLVLQPVCTEKH